MVEVRERLSKHHSIQRDQVEVPALDQRVTQNDPVRKGSDCFLF
ncbi:hypothetical protein SD77_1186 [Bacillus badius]|uniref:Uncharacterized protein n=1 Tax=Bacillus badius TaxID=1455 RepID=A0ABR5ASX8_BACBA|nr:hypothetical protein SD78_2792 [Bacillus badius]KIL77857.1 hypothetical protein SD77_1186 [Bacillus badius]